MYPKESRLMSNSNNKKGNTSVSVSDCKNSRKYDLEIQVSITGKTYETQLLVAVL